MSLQKGQVLEEMIEINNDSRKDLLLKIQEADFFLYDLQLYLDTHPRCERALKLYVASVEEAKKLRCEYESKYGPLTATASSSASPWQWSKNPWTWEKERS